MAVILDVTAPRRRLWHDALLVVGASLFIAISAAITIPLPFTPVPVTAQTLAVLLIGALLGSRLGALAVLAYIAEGLAGLPVFSGGSNAWSPTRVGVPWIVGPTVGYVVPGFLVAAWLTGWLAERGWDRRIPSALAAMVAGQIVIYAFGLLGLLRFVPYPEVLTAGLIPFLPGDAFKIALAALALPGGWAALHRLRG